MLIKANAPVNGRSLGTPPAKKPADRSLLDTFRRRYEQLDIHLDQPEYQNVPDLAAARMLGHFTQTMQNQGYPWRLYAAVEDPKKGYRQGEAVSDLEALQRLKKGEPLMLQPMRDLQLDLSSGSITAVATAGTLAGGQMAPLGKVADYSRTTQVNAGSQGISLKFGEPLVLGSYGELKLLHQMYDSSQKVEGSSPTARAAHQLSYFTQKTMGSAYPWRFYAPTPGNAALRVAKHTARGLLSGAAVGAALTGAVGGLLALGLRNPQYLWGAAAVGATLGAAKGGYDAAQSSLKGEPINAVDALERVLSNEEVVFQETRARSIGLPIVGKISWFADQGKGSTLSSVDDLNTFYFMQSGAELPKPAPQKPEPPAPSVVMVEQTVQNVHHHYYGGV